MKALKVFLAKKHKQKENMMRIKELCTMPAVATSF